ncbi:MAG: AMP-binding protein [Desulfofustis sp.]|nr:AMP-binding protein [Desulfofustis sp.]
MSASVAVYPDKTAVVYGEKRYSYKDFGERVYRVASALKKQGVGKGDKVAFICPNIPPMREAHCAVQLIGADDYQEDGIHRGRNHPHLWLDGGLWPPQCLRLAACPGTSG